MTHPEYFVVFGEHRGKTLREFGELLDAIPKKSVGSVTIAELCSMSEYPNGLYLFYDEQNELWYVGKSTSRSFIERIPSHFDQRENAWFNTLPKRIMAIAEIGEYADAHAQSLSMRLVLIGIQSKESALKLETVLRGFLRPQLNKIDRLSYTGSEPLSAYAA